MKCRLDPDHGAICLEATSGRDGFRPNATYQAMVFHHFPIIFNGSQALFMRRWLTSGVEEAKSRPLESSFQEAISQVSLVTGSAVC